MGSGTFRLTDAQIASYHELGFVVPSFKFDDDVLAKMRNAYDRVIQRNPGLDPDLMLGPHTEKPGAQGLKGDAQWMDFVTQPELLDIAAQLIGDDLILWATTLFGKPAYCGKETPWHQDGDYYPIRPLETMSIWIALDDATPENGCLRYIPGSHKQHKLFSHHWQDGDDLTINKVCDAEHFDESTAHDLILEAGQVAFHDVYMIHGSGPNTTDKRRAAYIVRLMPGTSHYDHELGVELSGPHQEHDYGRRPLYLLRGKDQTGRNNFDIGH